MDRPAVTARIDALERFVFELLVRVDELERRDRVTKSVTISAAKAAAMLDVDERTVRRWAARGFLDGYQLGVGGARAPWVVTRASVERLVQSRTSKARAR